MMAAFKGEGAEGEVVGGLGAESWDLPREQAVLLAVLQAQQAQHEEALQRLLRDEFKTLALRLTGEGPESGCGHMSSGRSAFSGKSSAPLVATRGSEQSRLLTPVKAQPSSSKQSSAAAGTAQSLRQVKSALMSEAPAAQVASDDAWERERHMFTSHVREVRISEQIGVLQAGQALYHQCDIYLAARIVERSRIFAFFVEVLIFANGVTLGVQQDYLARNLGAHIGTEWLVLDAAFAGFFCLELLVRITAAGRFFISRSNREVGWNLFDTLLVISANMEILFKVTSSRTIVDMSTGRVLRMMRLVRIVRVVRVLRFFKDLRVMVLSILSSLRPLVFALCLLAMLIYVVSTFLMHFVTEELILLRDRHGRESGEFQELYGLYGNLVTTTYTLFLSISGGVNWGDAARPLWRISHGLGAAFILYMSFSVFCVLNIITGIFVEEATTKTCEDEEHMLIRELEKRKRFIAEAKRFFQEADKEGTGYLTWPDFRERLQNVRMQTLLEHLGIDVIACGVENVFQMFDFDGNGVISVNEFTAGLQRLGGGARSIEIAGMRFEQEKMAAELDEVKDSFKELVQCKSQPLAPLPRVVVRPPDAETPRTDSPARPRPPPPTPLGASASATPPDSAAPASGCAWKESL